MKTIAITGAGGFLGSALLKQLVTRQDVRIYAFTFDFERERPDFIKNEAVIPVDNSEVDTFDFSGVDVVIHCAFPRNAASSIIADGLDFVARVLKRAAAAGAVINISSQSVYDPNRIAPAAETDKCFLDSKYAVGKYASELLNNTLCAGIPHTNIRMASLIGPGFDQRVTNKLVNIALETGSLTVNDDAQYFGYLDIEDAARGILSLLDIPAQSWKTVYNLGSARTYTLKTIAETVADVIGRECGKKIEIQLKPADAVLNSSLDADRLKTDTGFVSSVSLEESITRILAAKLGK